MEVLFGSDASIRGPAAVLSTHVDGVCVNCHPKFEFLNDSIVEHVILWFILTFIIYLVHIVNIEARALHRILGQPHSSPTHGTPIDEVLVIYVRTLCIFMFIL